MIGETSGASRKQHPTREDAIDYSDPTAWVTSRSEYWRPKSALLSPRVLYNLQVATSTHPPQTRFPLLSLLPFHRSFVPNRSLNTAFGPWKDSELPNQVQVLGPKLDSLLFALRTSVKPLSRSACHVGSTPKLECYLESPSILSAKRAANFHWIGTW